MDQLQTIYSVPANHCSTEYTVTGS